MQETGGGSHKKSIKEDVITLNWPLIILKDNRGYIDNGTYQIFLQVKMFGLFNFFAALKQYNPITILL